MSHDERGKKYKKEYSKIAKTPIIFVLDRYNRRRQAYCITVKYSLLWRIKKMRVRNQHSKSEIEAENPKDRAKPREHEEQRQDNTQN